MRFSTLLQLGLAVLTMSLNNISRGQDLRLPASDQTATKALTDSPRHGEWVEVAMEGTEQKLRCFVVYPERKEKAPVVIVIHEIFGLSDWVRSVADQLAAEGFIAIAPDYLSGKGPDGGGTSSFQGDAIRAAIRELSPEDIEKRTTAARAYGIALPAANGKAATIGFCWGGAASFAYATRQPALNGAVVYYGSPPSDKAALATIACPVLGCYGGDDARITATVEPTIAAMKEAGKVYLPHVFEGAGHGFLRQQSGKEGANLKASQAAWNATVAFLKENLEK